MGRRKGMGRILERWIPIGCTVQGKSHKRNNIPCQDSVGKSINSGTICVSLSDGAGSASKSDIGSNIITSVVSTYVAENFIDLYKISINKLKCMILEKVINSILEYGNLNTLREYASTMLFVAVNKNRYIAGHIGDGIILRITKKRKYVLSHPENGEFINQTYFITDDNALDHIRIYRGNAYVDTSFILMSDGVSPRLFNKRIHKIANACQIISSWLYNEPIEKSSKLLLKTINKFIHPHTSDDCSIIILSRIRHDIDKLYDMSTEYKKSYLSAKNTISMKNRMKILTYAFNNGIDNSISDNLKMNINTINNHIKSMQDIGIYYSI